MNIWSLILQVIMILPDLIKIIIELLGKIKEQPKVEMQVHFKTRLTNSIKKFRRTKDSQAILKDLHKLDCDLNNSL